MGQEPALPQIGFHEDEPRIRFTAAGALEHFPRIIDSPNRCQRPLREEMASHLTGSTSEIRRRTNLDLGNSRKKVEEGPGAFPLEALILVGIPGH